MKRAPFLQCMTLTVGAPELIVRGGAFRLKLERASEPQSDNFSASLRKITLQHCWTCRCIVIFVLLSRATGIESSTSAFDSILLPLPRQGARCLDLRRQAVQLKCQDFKTACGQSCHVDGSLSVSSAGQTSLCFE